MPERHRIKGCIHDILLAEKPHASPAADSAACIAAPCTLDNGVSKLMCIVILCSLRSVFIDGLLICCGTYGEGYKKC